MPKENRTIHIPSYNKIWKLPIKIYSIENTKLFVPINLVDAGIFIIIELAVIFLNRFIEPIRFIPFMLKFGVIPFMIVKIITIVKLEGKSPHKYFFDLFIFWLMPKKYEYFRPVKNIKKMSFNSKIYFKG